MELQNFEKERRTASLSETKVLRNGEETNSFIISVQRMGRETKKVRHTKTVDFLDGKW